MRNAENVQRPADRDRSRISFTKDWEVRHWTEKYGVSVDELRTAVEKVGPMADDVERYLTQNQRTRPVK